jgi:hypothetical protein
MEDFLNETAHLDEGDSQTSARHPGATLQELRHETNVYSIKPLNVNELYCPYYWTVLFNNWGKAGQM